MNFVTLAILAGGKARRLGGVPKGLIDVQGATIVERLCALRSEVDAVLLVGDDTAAYASFDLRRVPDPIPCLGAPGGLLGALEATRTEWTLVVGADMPFVTLPVVELLLSARAPEVEAVCFEVGGRWQPLLAVYRASLAPRVRAALAEQPSMTSLLERFASRVLPESTLAKVDPSLRSVRGINTKEEADAVGARLPSNPGQRLP